MAEVKNNIFNNNIAGDTSNILVPDTSAIKSGVTFKSNINSNALNGYFNLLSESIQFLQFTGGLYDDNADYDEGNIASLVIKNGEDYSIWQFRRNANNPRVLNNNPPISGASIDRVNGVDAYEGGTLNTDWDKLTEDYAIEATANTVMGRDSEGASNVNMPSSITNTSIVNNQYLQQQLQAGLSTKQDKLTAGTNITISEDNVISASGDLATKADLVSYDNSKTNLEYMSGYDFPKFKIEIPETINLVLADADNTAEYQAAIIKQADGSYVLNASIENYTLTSHSQSIFFIIKSIDSNINVYQIYSILSQFFSFNSIYNLELNECRISNIEYELKSTIGFTTESYTVIAISKQDLTNFNQGSYNITLNIKNRVLRNEDRNIFAFFAFMSSPSVLDCYNFTLEQDNNNVKLKGEYTLKEGAGVVIGFYSPIIENYFNVSSGTVNLQNTTGITSSSGKPLKFGIYKSSNDEVYRGRPPYILFVDYQDDSTIQVGDTITFNLTPDKNSTLNPIYQDAANVQQAIESIVLNKIMPIGATYIQFAEDNGTFDASKSPEKLFGGTWQLKYNTESVFFRTEGSLSEEGRSNGIQGDAIRNITGNFDVYHNNNGNHNNWENSPFSLSYFTSPPGGFNPSFLNNGIVAHININFNASKVVTTASENRTKNRKIRIYKRIA